MNCTKLNQDITRLQNLRDKFARKIDNLNEAMRGKIETYKVQEELREAEDQILESYLADFKEKNPELFKWRLGERIEGFENNLGGICEVFVVAQLPDGGMLVGGDDRTLYKCRKREDGVWELGRKIEGFVDDDFDLTFITTIAPLPDDGMLIGGNGGILYECRKDQDGKWKLKRKIFIYDGVRYVDSIAQLPDGGMLVGCCSDQGAILYECRKNGDGEWELGKRNERLEVGSGAIATISSIAQLPDDGMLIGSDFGLLCECRKNKNGEWELGKKIEGFGETDVARSMIRLLDGGVLIEGYGTDESGVNVALYEYRKKDSGEWELGRKIDAFDNVGRINSMVQLPDGEVLIGGENNVLYGYLKNKDGEWELVEKIEGLKYGRFDTHITSIAQLPDGGVLIGGNSGLLYEATRPSFSIDTIKQNLDSIIEKGVA